MNIEQKAALMKQVSPALAASDISLRDNALKAVSRALLDNRSEIFEANRIDLQKAEEDGLSGAVIKRLTFNEAKLLSVTEGINSLLSLPDPIGNKQLVRELDEGLVLTRITCPIGVIGVIFEARPDALVQISSLCIKSGNCCLLKGGSETVSTNRKLFDIIYKACIEAGLPEGFMVQAEARSEISELLKCDSSVDLIIPRGSNSFVKYIMDNTRIPVMGHADGVCHTYVDRAADLNMALNVLTDAKTQYVSVCNATETLLLNDRVADAFLLPFAEEMVTRGVQLFGNAAVYDALKAALKDRPELMTKLSFTEINDEDYHLEHLDYKLSVKLVKDVREAVSHINRFGSHHTDCIITEDDEAAEYFMQLTDSANVYRNCSTRFADGFRYGFGAEVGISTGKLHARGPVGLEGLVTYKYLLRGSGNIVRDYAEGRKEFHFKDLQN